MKIMLKGAVLFSYIFISFSWSIRSQPVSLNTKNQRIDSLNGVLEQTVEPDKRLDIKIRLLGLYRSLDLERGKALAEGAIGDTVAVGDTELKLRLVLASADIYHDTGEYGKAIELAQRGYRQGRAHGLGVLSFRACLVLGLSHFGRGEVQRAISILEEAVALSEAVKDEMPNAKSKAFNNLAVICHQEGKYNEALDYYHKAYESLGPDNKRGMGINLINTSYIHKERGETKRAIETLLESAKIFEELEQPGLLNHSYEGLSQNYVVQGQRDSALWYGRKALAVAEQINRKPMVSSNLRNMGRIHHSLGQLDSALTYLEGALALERDIRDVENYPLLLNELSLVHTKLGNLQRALETAKMYHALAQRTHLLPDRQQSNLRLYEVYKKMGRPGPALLHFESYVDISDSLFSKEKFQEKGRLEAGFAAREKEMAQKARIGLQQEKIRQQATVNNFIVTVLALMLLLSMVLLLVIRTKRRNNQRLLEKNREITEQKDKIEAQETLLLKSNTDLGRAVDKLKKTQSQLVQSQKMASLGVLVAGVAHEMNNPINFSHTGIHAIKKRMGRLRPLLPAEGKGDTEVVTLVEEIDDLLHSVENGTRRTAKIIKDLGLFSHNGNDKFDRVSVNKVLDNMLEQLEEGLSTIRVVRNYGEVPPIEAPETKLGQVFLNIIRNAAQAMDGKGTLEIATTVKNRAQVMVTIKDDGPGISREMLPQIFDPFFTTKPVGQGTGLGLSISYHIVQQLQGSISCQSSEGKGTSFSILLPKRQREPQKTTES